MKYKKCPVCGRMNPVRNAICEGDDCGESLIGVSVVNYTPAEQQPQFLDHDVRTVDACSPDTGSSAESGGILSTASRSAVSGSGYMRQCPSCKRVFPYRHKRCECGTSLVGAPPYVTVPTASSAESEQQACQMPKHVYVLRSEDGHTEIELEDGADIIIGREAAGADYLEGRDFVGRRHARIIVSGDSVSLEHMGLNPTLVNGRELKKNVPYSLNEGDLLAFGAHPYQTAHPRAAYFRLRRKTVE